MRTLVVLATVLIFPIPGLRADPVTPGTLLTLVAGITGTANVRPECALSPSGHLFVAWNSQLGVGYLVIDAAGTIVVGPNTIFIGPGLIASNPKVTANAAGFLLAIESPTSTLGPGRDVSFFTFSPTGVAIASGLVSSLANAALWDEFAPACAGSLNGEFAIAWVRRPLNAGPTAGVFVRRFNILGIPLDVGEVEVSGMANYGNQDTPALTVFPTGRVYVVWKDGTVNGAPSLPSPDGSGSGIVGRIIETTPVFAPVNPAFIASGNILAGDQWAPRLSNDHRATQWLGFNSDTAGGGFDAFAVQLGETGGWAIPIHFVTPTDGVDQQLDSLSTTPNGEYVATWTSTTAPIGQPAARSGYVRGAPGSVALHGQGLILGGGSAATIDTGSSVACDSYGNFRCVVARRNGMLTDLILAPFRREMITFGGTGAPGTTLVLNFSSPADSGNAFRYGISLGLGPIAIDTRSLALSFDPLLSLTLTLPSFASNLDAGGNATLAFAIPAIPTLSGVTFHFAFVTIDAFQAAPSGINTVSSTHSLIVP